MKTADQFFVPVLLWQRRRTAMQDAYNTREGEVGKKNYKEEELIDWVHVQHDDSAKVVEATHAAIRYLRTLKQGIPTPEVGQFVAKTSTEVHGGMGFTDLVGLHYWFKRIGFNRQLLGSPEAVRHEIALLQGLGTS